MEMVISLLMWLLAIAAALYLLILAIATWGWFVMKPQLATAHDDDLKVSILVACRNESENIGSLLECLIGQDYPSNLIEIVVIDDHSVDNTMVIVSEFINRRGLNTVSLISSHGKGKKAALSEGIKNSSGELIVTTDADCEMGKKWLSSIVSCYLETGAMLIAGPVVHFKEKGLSQHFFSLDFLSLVAFGAGSIGVGLPFLGNGANLAFSREATIEIQNVNSEKFVSGDDVFLIQKMEKNFGSKAINFLKNPSAVVHTEAPENWKQFILQRSRWGSKSKGYLSFWSLLVPLVVFISNLLMVAVFVVGLIYPWLFVIYLLYVLLKTLVDLPLLLDFSNYFGKRKLLRYILPFEFIYPFYITYAGFLSLFSKFSWKGREGLN